MSDSKTGKLTKILTLDHVERDHVHWAEYRKGDLYISRRLGTRQMDNTGYTTELWRYSASGKQTKLWSSKSLDFRVNNDGSIVAVLAQGDTPDSNMLCLLDSNGKILKKITAKDAGVEAMEYGGWAGRNLWIREQFTIDINSLLTLNASDMSVKKYDLSHLCLVDENFALNTTTLKIAYSDHPVFFEVDGYGDFVRSKTPVKLYVYDLRTKTKKTIAQATAKAFTPKWVGENVLEYNNPAGKGRVRKTIR